MRVNMSDIAKTSINFLKSRSILIPIILGVLFSLFSNLFNWDLQFQNLFWDDHLAIWIGKENVIASFFYHYGIIPAVVIPLLSLIIHILSYSFKSILKFRTIALYLFLVLAIGNGILANGLLKEYWGRPRPAQIVEYNGTQPYEPSLWINFESYGKSFPCGHATMGFYFFSLALLFQKRVRISIITFALIFGLVIGIVRSSMGGHFLTDTVWSAIFMWIVSKAIYLKLQLNKNKFYSEETPKSKFEKLKKKLIQLALVPLSLLFIIAVLLASPRDKVHSIIIPPIESQTIQLNINQTGIIYLKSNSDHFLIKTHAVGFGFPKSKLISKYQIEPSNSITLSHEVSGFFSELNASTTIHLPSSKEYEIRLEEPFPEKIYLNSVEIENFEDSFIIE